MLKVMKLLLIRFKVYMRILLILLRLLLIFMSMLKTLRIVLITYPPDSEIFSIIPLLNSGGKPERLNFLRSLISLLLPKDLRKRQLIALIITAVITMVIRLVEMEVL